MKFPTKIQTLYLTIGPSCCGKSFFSQNVLIPGLSKVLTDNGIQPNIQYISSDAIRRELLGNENIAKTDPTMMAASPFSFDLLYTKLRMATSFPINAHFVVIDTTGLSEDFRQDIIKIAKQQNYNLEVLLFNFSDREDYYRLLDKDDVTNKTVVSKHIRRLNLETMREIKRRDFGAIHTIKTNKFDTFTLDFDIQNLAEYKTTQLSNDKAYTVIGDIHGCIDELKALIQDSGFTIAANKIVPKERHDIILVGDLFDKGYDFKAVVDFVYNNQDVLTIVKGNHENFVWKLLNNMIDNVDMDFVNKYIDSYPFFLKDEDARKKFFELFAKMPTFVQNKRFIVTHAPCKNSVLGKFHGSSMKDQRNHMYPRGWDFPDFNTWKTEVEKHFNFLKEDANRAFPTHVFGHLAVKERLSLGNKLGIDTGCVYGGKMTSVTFNSEGKTYFCEAKAGPQIKPDNVDWLPVLFPYQERERVQLDDDSMYRIKKLAEAKVNFISGTVSPSDKDEKTNYLETLDKAFEYYKSNGVTELVLQPKYMGSRCNMYLFQELEKCYAVTRNGFKIHWLDLKPVFEKMLIKLKPKMEAENIELLMLDGELMPWSALGKGLIQEQYEVVKQGIGSELDLLTNNDFEAELAKLNAKSEAMKFKEISNSVPKKEAQKLLGQNQYATFSALQQFQWHPIHEQNVEVSVFNEQLELYGSDGELDYKPFAYLKTVYKDGREKTHFEDDNHTMFAELSTDKFTSVNLNDEISMASAREFYTHVTHNHKMEGVVVKPRKVFIEKIAPFLKVRNPRYLTLIYGYDYLNDHKFKKLMRQKGIKRKLAISIAEYQIGKKMLEVPYHSIDINNKDWFNLMAKMIQEEQKEKSVDPRL